jgi:hypothetical protein
LARLFLSHSSENNAQVIALNLWLAEQGFDDVFLDIDPVGGLVPGERWQEALRAAEFLLAKSLHKRIFGLLIERVELDKIPVEMRSAAAGKHARKRSPNSYGPFRELDRAFVGAQARVSNDVVAFCCCSTRPPLRFSDLAVG